MICIDCKKIEQRHEESIGDLQCIRAIESFFTTREMAKLEQSIKIFQKRLLERHNNITGR